MKKIILLLVLLTIVTSGIFSLTTAEDKEWIKWFQQRNWVEDDGNRIPIYKAMNGYLGRIQVKHELYEGDHYIIVTGDSYALGSTIPIEIIYYVDKDPVIMGTAYFKFGDGGENASWIIYDSLIRAIKIDYLK